MISDKKRIAILRSYMSGNTSEAVGKIHGVTRQTACRIAKIAGKTRGSNNGGGPISEPGVVEKHVAAYLSGKPTVDIIKEYGISSATLYDALRKAKATLRSGNVSFQEGGFRLYSGRTPAFQ